MNFWEESMAKHGQGRAAGAEQGVPLLRGHQLVEPAGARGWPWRELALLALPSTTGGIQGGGAAAVGTGAETVSRYRASEATVTITPVGGRLLVRWSGARSHQIRESFRGEGWRHSEATWSPRARAWAVS